MAAMRSHELMSLRRRIAAVVIPVLICVSDNGHADGMPIVRLNWECGLSVKEVYLARVYRT